MTTDTDKLVEMARAAGFKVGRYSTGQRYIQSSDGTADVTKELAAFASAHIASLCGDVEPVAHIKRSKGGDFLTWYAFDADCEPCYSASTVAALKAERDAALARVAELEKDAQDHLDTVQAIFDAIGYTKEYAMQWPKEKASVTFKRWFDEQMRAALTKGQP